MLLVVRGLVLRHGAVSLLNGLDLETAKTRFHGQPSLQSSVVDAMEAAAGQEQ